MPRIADLTGLICGDLTILAEDSEVFFGKPHRAWLCQCKCGSLLRVPTVRLAALRWAGIITNDSIHGDEA